jgi:hypothetical protein
MPAPGAGGIFPSPREFGENTGYGVIRADLLLGPTHAEPS